MKRIPKGGPVTKAGKKVSSRNSTTHGLTAKRWSNSTEQENYHAFLAALIVDFQPKTVIEHTLIEKLADTRTRLDRFHHVEDALFTLAQERAESPDHVVNSFGVVDDQGVLEELSDHSFGIPYRYDPIPKKLFKELINHDLSDVSGWGYITDNMPVLREHIIEECRKHNVDVEDLMSRHKVQEDSSGVLNIVIRDYEKPKLLTEQTLEESRLKCNTNIGPRRGASVGGSLR